MGSWTLRQQRLYDPHGNRSQDHAAARRAVRYVRRHAREFHGAGVEEAVRDLAALSWASRSAREGVASVLAAFDVPAETVFGETAHGLTVVGWRCTKGLVFCPEHRGCGNVPVTSGDLNTAPGSPFECFDCGKDLRPPLNTVCLCTHPYSSHNVNGLCIAFPGVLGCGCMGWSEAQS